MSQEDGPERGTLATLGRLLGAAPAQLTSAVFWIHGLNAIAVGLLLQELLHRLWLPTSQALIYRLLALGLSIAAFGYANAKLRDLRKHANRRGRRSGWKGWVTRPIPTVAVSVFAALLVLGSFLLHQVMMGRCVIEVPTGLEIDSSLVSELDISDGRADPVKVMLVPVVHTPALTAVFANHKDNPVIAVSNGAAEVATAAATSPGLVLITRLLFLLSVCGIGVGLALTASLGNHVLLTAWMHRMQGERRRRPAAPRPDAGIARYAVSVFVAVPVPIILLIFVLWSAIRRTFQLEGLIRLHPYVDGPVRIISLLLAIGVVQIVIALWLWDLLSEGRRTVLAIASFVLAVAAFLGIQQMDSTCRIEIGSGEARTAIYRPLVLPEHVARQVRQAAGSVKPKDGFTPWETGYQEIVTGDPELFADECRYFDPHLLALTTFFMSVNALAFIGFTITGVVMLGEIATGLEVGDAILSEVANQLIWPMYSNHETAEAEPQAGPLAGREIKLPAPEIPASAAAATEGVDSHA